MFLSYTGIAVTIILAMIVKPILLIKLAGFSGKDIESVFVPCVKVSIVAFVPSLIAAKFLSGNYLQYALLVIIVIAFVFLSVFYIGIEKEQRNCCTYEDTYNRRYGCIEYRYSFEKFGMRTCCECFK